MPEDGDWCFVIFFVLDLVEKALAKAAGVGGA
jgi:hypothetical protein